MLSKITNTRRGVVFSTLSALSMAQDVEVYCDAKVKKGFTALFYVVDLDNGSGQTERVLSFYEGTPGEDITIKMVDTCADGVVFRTFGPVTLDVNGTLVVSGSKNTSA